MAEITITDWIAGELGDVRHHCDEILTMLKGVESEYDPDATTEIGAVGTDPEEQVTLSIRAGDELDRMQELAGQIPTLTDLPKKIRVSKEYLEVLLNVNAALMAVSADQGNGSSPDSLRTLRGVLELVAEVLKPGGRGYQLAYGER